MKKRLLFLLWILYGTNLALSQTTITFRYPGFDSIPPCYLEDGDDWKTSHGSPCYVAYSTPGLYNNLLFATNFNGITLKSEGAFINYNFTKCNKYQIEIHLRDTKGLPTIEVYAANNLKNKKNTKCQTDTLPIVADKDKHLIGWESASCNALPLQMCTKYFPSKNSYWTPDKEYSQLWITSGNSTADSTSFFINEIIVNYEQIHTTPPSIPENLHATSAAGSTITVSWSPSTGANGVKIDQYSVSCDNKTYFTTSTACTITNLKECTAYGIYVKAVDQCNNVSPAASITAETSTNLPADVVLENTINLSNYPNKRYIVQATNTIRLRSGFSVKANDTQDYFRARISTGCGDILLSPPKPDDVSFDFMEDNSIIESSFINDFQQEEETIYIKEDNIDVNSLSIFSSHLEKEILIYPNPTPETLFIKYDQSTGNEKVILFDITGRPLCEHTLSGIISNINISQFSPGVYLIKVITQEKIIVHKLIKM